MTRHTYWSLGRFPILVTLLERFRNPARSRWLKRHRRLIHERPERFQEVLKGANVTLWQIRTIVDDEPGRLAALAGSLAESAVNILSVQVHPVVHGAVDEFVADAPAELTEEDLVAAVAAGGGRRAVVRPADVHGLADPPTKALQLAHRVLRDPDALADALSELVEGAAVRWSPSPLGAQEVPDAGGHTTVRLRDPRGGTLVLSRLDARITPSEAARARGLAALATTLEHGPSGGPSPLPVAGWDGSEVRALTDPDVDPRIRWRPVGSADLPALSEMHLRCSSETRARRYLSGAVLPPRRQLARLVNPQLGVCLGAEAADGHLVALGNLAWTAGHAELGLLVEDDWQRRGLGSALARRLLASAVDADLVDVVAIVQPDNLPMLRLLAGLGLPTRRERRDGLVTVTVELAAVFGSAPAPG
jgi:GNAT superfamily N-acetyltransferase